MSFAFCGNRAGNGTKEILNYDPCQQDQCRGGISVYLSAQDQLVDVDLARHILMKDVAPLDGPHCSSHVQLCVDRTVDSFHGRWLVEIWCGGLFWGAPCASTCLSLLEERLGIGAAGASNRRHSNRDSDSDENRCYCASPTRTLAKGQCLSPHDLHAPATANAPAYQPPSL